MAKCVGAVYSWVPEEKFIDNADFLVDNVRQGEMALKKRLELKCDHLLLEIVSDYVRIKQSALCDEEFKLDCSQVQDALVTKLKALFAESSSVVRAISNANLIASTKHRYFIQFAYGFIEKLHQLMQMTGRLCEVDQKIYLEEQRKLLTSEESIALHSLSTIWSTNLAILNDFCQTAQFVFNPKSGDQSNDCEQEYDFLDQLEFSTARLHVARTFLMDLIITSWIKFNRLVKYDDLVKSIPFICPCHMKLFFQIIEGTREAYRRDEVRNQLMIDLLKLMLDPQCKPSLITTSTRRPGVIPLDPCYATANKFDLAYFLIWHLYALCTRIKTPSEQAMLANCADILEEAIKIVKEAFRPNLAANCLSPHQEERFKLLGHMLKVWCGQQWTRTSQEAHELLSNIKE